MNIDSNNSTVNSNLNNETLKLIVNSNTTAANNAAEVNNANELTDLVTFASIESGAIASADNYSLQVTDPNSSNGITQASSTSDNNTTVSRHRRAMGAANTMGGLTQDQLEQLQDVKDRIVNQEILDQQIQAQQVNQSQLSNG